MAALKQATPPTLLRPPWHPLCIPVVTCVGPPCSYTTRSRIVLASRPPMTVAVVAGLIGHGDHVLRACCHMGGGGRVPD